MPLSIVEGHKEGAVMDVAFFGCSPSGCSTKWCCLRLGNVFLCGNPSHQLPREGEWIPTSRKKRVFGNIFYPLERMDDVSFKRDCPIAHVPPSCFAMANLSPAQQGYGALQMFSIFVQRRQIGYFSRRDECEGFKKS